ncbi:MAG: hypothetical protein FJ134_10325 [Deltaproteobacteria bacterium]|nr:hypothetical protein [Deltaproteobacteria bacterium]
MKIFSFFMAFCAISLLLSSPAYSTSYTIPITSQGDAVYHYYYEGSDPGGGGPLPPPPIMEWLPSASPNKAGYYNNMPNVPFIEESWLTLMEFDIRGLGPGAITSATINLYIVNNTSGPSGSAQIGYIPQALTGPATGNAAIDQFTGGTYIGHDGLPYYGWAGVEVTPFLQTDRSAGFNYTAYTMEWPGTPNYGEITFASGEDPTYFPFLQVELTAAAPTPSSLLLTGTGLLGLLGLGRVFRKI